MSPLPSLQNCIWEKKHLLQRRDPYGAEIRWCVLKQIPLTQPALKMLDTRAGKMTDAAVFMRIAWGVAGRAPGHLLSTNKPAKHAPAHHDARREQGRCERAQPKCSAAVSRSASKPAKKSGLGL